MSRRTISTAAPALTLPITPARIRPLRSTSPVTAHLKDEPAADRSPAPAWPTPCSALKMSSAAVMTTRSPAGRQTSAITSGAVAAAIGLMVAPGTTRSKVKTGTIHWSAVWVPIILMQAMVPTPQTTPEIRQSVSISRPQRFRSWMVAPPTRWSALNPYWAAMASTHSAALPTRSRSMVDQAATFSIWQAGAAMSASI